MGSLRLQYRDGYALISARKINILLATLLIRAERTVSVEELMTEIWGAAPPRRATAALHVYISQLRKFLDRPGRKGAEIVTRAPGYVLHLGGDELDFHEFQHRIEQGRELLRAGEHERADDLLAAALELWREPVLGDLRNGPITNGFACLTDDMRMECADLLVTARTRLGRNHELIRMLRDLVTEHPLREEYHRQLVLSLHRGNRRAEALHAYSSARTVINRELGIEPCRALQDLHRSILASDVHDDMGREPSRGAP